MFFIDLLFFVAFYELRNAEPLSLSKLQGREGKSAPRLCFTKSSTPFDFEAESPETPKFQAPLVIDRSALAALAIAVAINTPSDG